MMLFFRLYNFKKTVLILPLIFFTFALIAQNKKYGDGSHFSIDGHILGHLTKMVILGYTDSSNNYITEKCNVINGRFSFKGSINQPTFAQLIGNVDTSHGGIDRNDPNLCFIFIEPKKMRIEVIENHFNNVQLSGSVTQNQYYLHEKSKENINNKFAPIDSSYKELNNHWKIALKANDTIESNRLSIKKNSLLLERKFYSDQLNRVDLRYITQHHNSFLSAFLLYHGFAAHSYNEDSVKVYFNKLSQIVQNSNDGKELARLLNKKVAPIGSNFYNIKGNDIDGKDVSIDNLLNDSSSYTVIVFWASWCSPCRALNPTFKKIYQKYHFKKLNIIFVTLDEDRKKWLTAIKNDTISDFHHIYNNNKVDIRHEYGISDIPADFLVKGRTIISKYAGADDDHSHFKDLEIKLQQIFN
ncbi:TlpA disulfide reductase family protein [Rhizosphaericola mali]|uniref:AhpC/TSA family protein n=1 Tax=Rhizosphaericola mali TaxID=2545455 RepID=A0A5P2G1U8_9BACT|nr:TlpA disulfide reductase family protein [Rhizosphaericola mali]QES88688.1 AhpC/TSA family protein [Rhizosphaericola mali]